MPSGQVGNRCGRIGSAYDIPQPGYTFFTLFADRALMLNP